MKSYALDSRQIKYSDVQKSKKDRFVAGLLALFLGAFGIHRFYLGQIGLGVVYCILCFFGAWPVMGFVALIDAVVLFAMDKDKFNFKYNRDWFNLDTAQRQQTTNIPQAKKTVAPKPPIDRYQRQQQERKKEELLHRNQRAELNRHKANGVAHFKEYDFKSAIVDFEKALAINPKDAATHFNLACAHSLLEDATKSLYHLDKAVANGFNDFARIKTHDSLAYLRIQEEYDVFAANKFRLPTTARSIPVQETTSKVELPKDDLLEQLKKLGDLRERGDLTDAEFMQQKQRLFR